MSSSVGGIVKFARERAGLSTRELSRAAGLSASYVSKLESGSIEPSLKAFSRLATVTGMTMLEIRYCLALAALGESEIVEES